MRGKLVYSSDRAAIVRKAREQGLTDAQILGALVSNEYSARTKRKIVREWAKHLGLTEGEAEDAAKKAGLF